MSVYLYKCPFCGKLPDPTDGDTIHPTGIYWTHDPDIGKAYFGRNHLLWNTDMHECWIINCPETSGGCGASMTGDTKEETILKWMTRA